MERISNPSVINHLQAELCSSDQISDHDERPYPWLQHYEEGVPVHLEFPDRPLTWLLDKAAGRHPNRVAFIYYGSRITYAQFSNLANRFAIGLQRLGVQKGDRVAIALPNIPQFPIAFYGALKAGAVVVPTNPLYTEREMRHQLADSGAKVIVMLDTFYASVRKIRQQTVLEHVVVTNPADFLLPSLRLLYPLQERGSKNTQPGLTKNDFAQDSTLHRMQPMLVSRTKGGIELFKLPVPTRSEDLAVLQYTGGNYRTLQRSDVNAPQPTGKCYATVELGPQIARWCRDDLVRHPFFSLIWLDSRNESFNPWYGNNDLSTLALKQKVP